MFIAKIKIMLKKGIFDPAGVSVMHSLNSIGFKEAKDVRVGKFIEIKLDINDKDKANEVVKQMCEKLLANMVVENYEYEIVDAI